MKKLGFTLAEVLITLTVVGIVSALTAPMVSNLIPDKDKINVLNTYNKIAKLTQDMLEDPTYYYPYISTSGRVLRTGLVSPTGTADINEIIKRYPNNLSRLITEEDAKAEGNQAYSFICNKDIKCRFYVPTERRNMDSHFEYEFTIILLYKKRATPCSYSLNCTNPDKFYFTVDNFGNITPQDALSQAFLLNQLNMNQKKEDLAKAKQLQNSIFIKQEREILESLAN